MTDDQAAVRDRLRAMLATLDHAADALLVAPDAGAGRRVVRDAFRRLRAQADGVLDELEAAGCPPPAEATDLLRRAAQRAANALGCGAVRLERDGGVWRATALQEGASFTCVAGGERAALRGLCDVLARALRERREARP